MIAERILTDTHKTDCGEQKIESAFSRFEMALWAAVKAQAEAGGVNNWGELSKDRQEELVMGFLQEYYFKRQRSVTLARQPEAGILGRPQVEVDPNLIELTVINQKGQEQTLRMAGKRKEILAYIALYTVEKTRRHLVPWLTRGELADHVPSKRYTKAQLYTYGLGPLAKAGILEVSQKDGFRLKCDPGKILEILQSEEPSHRLEIVGFDGWATLPEYPTILVGDYHLPVLRAVLEARKDASLEGEINVALLSSKVGLSKHTVYRQFNELEELGLAKRTGARYKFGDVNLEYVEAILQAQAEPIALGVSLKAAPIVPVRRIGERRAEALGLKVAEELEFPEVSFAESGAKTTGIEKLISDRGRLFWLVDQVLTAEFDFEVVFDKEVQVVYSGNFPKVEGVDQETVLGVLDFLGLGPGELGQITGGDKLPPTVAAIITNRLETPSQPQLKLQLLAGELKARLAGLIYETVVTAEEGRNYKFATVMTWLEEALAAETKEAVFEDAPEVILAPVEVVSGEEAPKIREVVKPEALVSRIDERLVEVIGKPFGKEFRLATSGSSLPNEWMTPLAASNFHRTLSRKADLMPWKGLTSLGLAVDHLGKDYHPHISPVGALVAAIFLKESVHSRVMSKEGNQADAIELVARYTTHFLCERLAEDIEEKERRYAQNCLTELRRLGFACECQACQGFQRSGDREN